MRNEIPLFVRNDRCCSVLGEEKGTAEPSLFPPLDYTRNCHSDGGTTEESHPMYYCFFKDDESTAKGLALCCHLLIMPNKNWMPTHNDGRFRYNLFERGLVGGFAANQPPLKS